MVGKSERETNHNYQIQQKAVSEMGSHGVALPGAPAQSWVPPLWRPTQGFPKPLQLDARLEHPAKPNMEEAGWSKRGWRFCAHTRSPTWVTPCGGEDFRADKALQAAPCGLQHGLPWLLPPWFGWGVHSTATESLMHQHNSEHFRIRNLTSLFLGLSLQACF